MEQFSNESAPPSKSAVKRQMYQLPKLGEELIALPKDTLKRMQLPDTLRTAVEEAQRIASRGVRSGLRRQLQYIGRLMREIDAQPVAEQLQQRETRQSEENARFHQLERWRDRLLADENSLSAFMEAYPHADSQPLRTLIRNAHKEIAAQRPPKSSRALFKLLREISEQDLAPGSTEL